MLTQGHRAEVIGKKAKDDLLGFGFPRCQHKSAFAQPGK